MDRHEFIRMTLIQEEMEQEEKRRAAAKEAAKAAASEKLEDEQSAEAGEHPESTAQHSQGGWPMGVHLISTDPGDIEW